MFNAVQAKSCLTGRLKILGPAGCDTRHQNGQISIQEVQVSNESVSEITAWLIVLTRAQNIIPTSSNKCIL